MAVPPSRAGESRRVWSPEKIHRLSFISTLLGYTSPAVIAGIQKHISANFLSIYKTLEDLKKTAVIDRSLPGNSLSLLTEDSCYLIDKVSFRVVAHNERTIAPVEHRLLGNDAMLSSSRVGDLDLVIVQTAGASQGKVFLQPVTTRKRHKQQAK
jgi:hypothetical protein